MLCLLIYMYDICTKQQNSKVLYMVWEFLFGEKIAWGLKINKYFFNITLFYMISFTNNVFLFEYYCTYNLFWGSYVCICMSMNDWRCWCCIWVFRLSCCKNNIYEKGHNWKCNAFMYVAIISLQTPLIYSPQCFILLHW